MIKQKISVRVIIRDRSKILLLRRAQGNDVFIGKWELPGLALAEGADPEILLRNYFARFLGLELQAIQLLDVINLHEKETGNHNLTILYQGALRASNVKLATKYYDKYMWQSLTNIENNDVTNITSQLLRLKNSDVTLGGKIGTDLILYSDGGSRGNPGPSAAAFVIFDGQENLLTEGGSYLGITTNNQAEYRAVYLGLSKALEYTKGTIEFRIDSLLVVNQMKGLYQIKNRDLWPIHEKIKQLQKYFKKVSYVHVKREFNQHADRLVNHILDRQAST